MGAHESSGAMHLERISIMLRKLSATVAVTAALAFGATGCTANPADGPTEEMVEQGIEETDDLDPDHDMDLTDLEGPGEPDGPIEDSDDQ